VAGIELRAISSVSIGTYMSIQYNNPLQIKSSKEEEEITAI